MKLKKSLWLAVGIALGSAVASAGTITYTCNSSGPDAIAAATCNYLNTTVAGLYSSTFTDANANIYITYGATGLASSSFFLNFISYSSYVAALNANPNKDALQSSALSALNTYDAGPYGGGDVEVAAALGTALGFTGLDGIESNGSTECTIGSGGCYNAYVTVTDHPSTPLYYDNLGGTEPSNAYDFYAAVQHETDEVLGTASCISTTAPSGLLTNPCGGGTPSAVDLYRYNAQGDLALNSSYVGLSGGPAGAYFSYNGGTTNGAEGAVYNTLANGDDYADFVSSTPCQTLLLIQDGVGCPGQDAGLRITNDGGAEINILNAVGYDLTTPRIPEPNTMVLLGAGLAILAAFRRRRAAGLWIV